MMRWWWFGPAVTKPGIRRELEQMKTAGIGGVELATLYPQQLDDPLTGFQNQTYLSDEHIDAIRYAADQARVLGLRFDLTLGSGWPFGGPHIPVTEAAGQLRAYKVPILLGATSVSIPYIDTGETLLAVSFVTADGHLTSATAPPKITNGRMPLAAAAVGAKAVVCIVAGRTGMMVKRPAVGAEGFVLDPYDAAATQMHLAKVGDRLMQAFPDRPPYAVFSDSLEVYGADWTGDLLTQFRARRGYDLTPHLTQLFTDTGPEDAAIRHDWGETLTELANENFLGPMHRWAQQHHTRLRSQTYGIPPMTLWSNRYVDLPEGEGKATIEMWRQFSDLRWASSAAHLLHRPVVSSETWTWLHSPAFAATPLDMKAEADLHFLYGINQLVGHGWPYSPPAEPEPGWRMYAAGAFNAHNPWFFIMPELTGYLQRTSYLLRQGEPVNDVAILLPNDDAWAQFKSTGGSTVTGVLGFDESGSKVSIDDAMPALLGHTLMPQILDAGFNPDYIDADAIQDVGIPYRVLILPDVARIPVAAYEAIRNYAAQGGIVIATRGVPSTAPGFEHAVEQTKRIQQISQELFASSGGLGHRVADESQLGAVLAGLLSADVTMTPKTPAIGFVHRKLMDGDVYFFANTDAHPHRVTLSVRSHTLHAELWDAFTGKTTPVDRAHLDFNFQPYESRVLVLSNQGSSAIRLAHTRLGQPPAVQDLSQNWQVTFEGLQRSEHFATLHSWTDEEPYYSGRAIYRKNVNASEKAIRSGYRLTLDFGLATALPLPSPLPRFNMRAYLDAPVRDVVEVSVNGHRAGTVWRPPYQLDITPWLHPGQNALRFDVANTAMNEIAGRSQPTDRLLTARFGKRFAPQDIDKASAQPSGLLGPLLLKALPPNSIEDHP